MEEIWNVVEGAIIIVIVVPMAVLMAIWIWFMLGEWRDRFVDLWRWVRPFGRIAAAVRRRSETRRAAHSEEVAAALDAVRQIEAEPAAIGFSLISPFVVAEIKRQPERTWYSIKEDGLSPKTLAFLITLNVLGVELLSGRYHAYRGVLNAPGHLLLDLWNYVVQQQVEAGYYDKKTAKRERKWIADEIQRVG